MSKRSAELKLRPFLLTIIERGFSNNWPIKHGNIMATTFTSCCSLDQNVNVETKMQFPCQMNQTSLKHEFEIGWNVLKWLKMTKINQKVSRNAPKIDYECTLDQVG